MVLHVQQQYRQFLKAAYTAAHRHHKQVIRDRIRRRFHDPPTTHAELKTNNTLAFLQNAALSGTMEHRIVRNICHYDALEKEYDLRPPHYNKKMTAAQRQIHDTAYDDLHLLIHMLNTELDMCL